MNNKEIIKVAKNWSEKYKRLDSNKCSVSQILDKTNSLTLNEMYPFIAELYDLPREEQEQRIMSAFNILSITIGKTALDFFAIYVLSYQNIGQCAHDKGIFLREMHTLPEDKIYVFKDMVLFIIEKVGEMCSTREDSNHFYRRMHDNLYRAKLTAMYKNKDMERLIASWMTLVQRNIQKNTLKW